MANNIDNKIYSRDRVVLILLLDMSEVSYLAFCNSDLRFSKDEPFWN